MELSMSICPVKKIDREDCALVITWQDGERSAFPHRWLRENAPENWHPLTGERLNDSCVLQEAPCPRSVAVEYDETLVVSWAGLWEVTRYSLSHLRDCPPAVESAELALVAD